MHFSRRLWEWGGTVEVWKYVCVYVYTSVLYTYIRKAVK